MTLDQNLHPGFLSTKSARYLQFYRNKMAIGMQFFLVRLYVGILFKFFAHVNTYPSLVSSILSCRVVDYNQLPLMIIN